jgi:hypothetical protein
MEPWRTVDAIHDLGQGLACFNNATVIGHSVSAGLPSACCEFEPPKVRMAHVQTLRGVNDRCNLFASLQQV